MEKFICRARAAAYLISFAFLLASCSLQKRIHRSAQSILFADSIFQNAHTGIAVFDPVINRFIYQYQADKYFTPASNMKILTLYAGLAYLPDSLPGLRWTETRDSILIEGTGDPSFLHSNFPAQPVFDFLKKQSKPIAINDKNWLSKPYGNGWMCDDYNDAYMPERSAFPIYGDVIKWVQIRDSGSIHALARQEAFIYSEPDINWSVQFSGDTGAARFAVQRAFTENRFRITQGKEENVTLEVPFITHGVQSALELLKDSLGAGVSISSTPLINPATLFSRPVDSLFKPMMYLSDNFFAEQILLMAAQQRFGTLDEHRIIEDLLKNDWRLLPQKPVWVDGSGLSRYNLVTPNDFVWILEKMKTRFGMNRLKTLFPTGRTGTLRNYFKADTNYIYAKTGTMSGIVCLSGYLYTSSGKLLLFSTLVNNHNSQAWMIRKKMESFLTRIALSY